MRFIALFLSLLMTCQLSFVCLPASASATYDPNSGFSGEAPVNKVGALLLTSSLAVMSGSTIQISARGQNGVSELSGQIFKTTKTNDQVSGYAFFGLGSELAKLDAVRCNEWVDKTDGTRVNGPVTDVNVRSVTCAGQLIPMDSVVTIHAARVFKFILKTGEHPKMEFTPTCAKLAAAAGGHHRRLTKIVIATLILAGIACAIAIPIAVSGHHHHNNSFANYYAVQQYAASQNQSQPAVTPPPVVTTTTTTVIVPTRPSGSSGSTGSTGGSFFSP